MEPEWQVPLGKVVKVTEWYAPGVGVVKQVNTYTKSDTVMVLKSFTAGMGEPTKDK